MSVQTEKERAQLRMHTTPTLSHKPTHQTTALFPSANPQTVLNLL